MMIMRPPQQGQDGGIGRLWRFDVSGGGATAQQFAGTRKLALRAELASRP